jgi:hypothetical protein
MPASNAAYHLLYDAIPCFFFDTKPELVRKWWEENRSKPEREWYLPELTATNQRQRCRAIQRLFALEDVSLHPQLFQALKTIEGEDCFQTAAQDASRLPKETIQREFSSYLNDSRVEVRFLAAKLTAPFNSREAIESLLSILQKPESLRSDATITSPQYKLVNWLAATKDDRVFPVLRKLLNEGDFEVKQDVLSAIGDLEDPRAEGMLLEVLSDTDRSSEPLDVGTIINPRMCDDAGWYLSRRMKLEDRFAWGEKTDDRDKNLAEIWKLYREGKGLPPAPFVLPGTTVVLPEEVSALLPDLASEEISAQRRALKKLSQLGGGAWPQIQERIKESQGQTRKRLEDVALAFANTLRKVDATEESKSYAKCLLDHLHEPLDVESFFREIIEPWFGDPACTRIRVEVSREPGGRGFKVKLDITKGDPKGPTPDNLDWHSHHHGMSARYTKDMFDHAWKEYLEPLRISLQPGNDGPFDEAMDMKKRASK